MNYFVGGCAPTPPSKPRFLQAFISSVVGNLSLLARRINGGKKLVTKTIDFFFMKKMMDFNLLTIGFSKESNKIEQLFIYFSSEMHKSQGGIERNKSKMAVVDRC